MGAHKAVSVRVKVLLVDDHKIVLDGLHAILDGEAGIEVTGRAEDGQAALTQVAKLRPHVVVIAVQMAGFNGIEATRRITGAHPGTKVIALSACDDRAHVLAMLEAGAVGYVVKQSTDGAELLRSIHTVAAGGKYLCAKATELVMEGLAEPRPRDHAAARQLLSVRECEVLQLLADGHGSKQIGVRLGISGKTVDVHRRAICKKLKLRGVAALTHYAIREGMVKL